MMKELYTYRATAELLQKWKQAADALSTLCENQEILTTPGK